MAIPEPALKDTSEALAVDIGAINISALSENDKILFKIDILYFPFVI